MSSSAEPSLPINPPHRYTTHDDRIDTQIAELIKPFGDELDRRLLMEMMVTAYRFGSDRATTGDLKLVNAALKELRYAFSIFRP
ncbi:MAG: hypothetical protein Q8R78_02140, partial [Candidatus Omnitrophota bacterium]|nr:hypothetical protein [Candidatus Omnitrophota bacterium]